MSDFLYPESTFANTSIVNEEGEDIDECLTLFANASKISPNVFALLKYCMMNVA